MKTDYFLVKDKYSTYIFSIEFEHTNEELAVYDFELNFLRNGNSYFENVIRKAFKNSFKYNLDASSPVELLRLMLANGFSLESHNLSFVKKLKKNFFQINFIARSVSQTIQLGHYYRSSVSTLDEQFPAFCKWIDEICGLSGRSRLLAVQLISANFSILAIEGGLETIIVATENGSISQAMESSLIFLTTD